MTPWLMQFLPKVSSCSRLRASTKVQALQIVRQQQAQVLDLLQPATSSLQKRLKAVAVLQKQTRHAEQLFRRSARLCAQSVLCASRG